MWLSIYVRWLRNKGRSYKVWEKYGQALAIKARGDLPSESPTAGWGLSISMQYLQAWDIIFHREFCSVIHHHSKQTSILWKLFRSWDVTTPDHKIHHAGETSGQCLALQNTVRQKLYLSLLELTDHPCSFRLAHTDVPAPYITIHQGDLLWNRPAATLA